jgi:CheY-like chemotaxis protein
MSNTTPDITLKTFALADDDIDDANLFQEALLEIDPGITVERASNGLELLDKMKSHDFHTPDIIFLDINMPEMNGWECLSQLKNDRQLKAIPVVMYSTSSNVYDRAKATKLGAVFFYTKPDTFQDLKKFLAGLITNPRTIVSTLE